MKDECGGKKNVNRKKCIKISQVTQISMINLLLIIVVGYTLYFLSSYIPYNYVKAIIASIIILYIIYAFSIFEKIQKEKFLKEKHSEESLWISIKKNNKEKDIVNEISISEMRDISLGDKGKESEETLNNELNNDCCRAFKELIEEIKNLKKKVKECNADVFVKELENEIKQSGGKEKLWKYVVDQMRIHSDKDEYFLEIIGNVYVQTLKKKKRNKDTYFEMETKSAQYQSLKNIIKGIYNQKTVIAAVITYIINTLLSMYDASKGKLIFPENWLVITSFIFGAFVLLGCIGFIFLKARAYQDEIEIRKYGETWVRHESTIFNMESVMHKFVFELDEYSEVGVGSSEKRLFMEQMLEVLRNNEEKFQRNMEKIT